MGAAITPVLSIANHPFYVGLIPADACYDLPGKLPFALGLHPRYAIPRLVLTDEIRAALAKAYSVGSMLSTPLGESRLATVRMDEFQARLTAVLGGLEGKKILEIGCGNGELLNQVRSRGAAVTGLEIGPQADVVEERYGIRVIREPLTVGSLAEKFDCIFSYGCLEHIEELDEFFAASRECLVLGGLFFHSVPNSALSFDSVQLDHLLHEHINYFTPANGTALLEAQGFRSADASLTRAGNEVMIWGVNDPAAKPRWPVERVEAETAMLDAYARKLEAKIRATLHSLRALVGEGKSIGFYAGGYEYGYLLGAGDVRYFDGDSYKHGKRWLQGLRPIEPPEKLRELPVDRLVICKPHYFDNIRDALVPLGIDQGSLLKIDDLARVPA